MLPSTSPVAWSSCMASSRVSTREAGPACVASKGSAPRRPWTMARIAMTVAATVMNARPILPVSRRPVLARALNTATKVLTASARSRAGMVANQRPAT
jgi:hypothetical protein